jgi:hypothetical protein
LAINLIQNYTFFFGDGREVSSKQGAEECSVITLFSFGFSFEKKTKKKKRKWQWVDMNGWTDKQMHVPEEARRW